MTKIKNTAAVIIIILSVLITIGSMILNFSEFLMEGYATLNNVIVTLTYLIIWVSISIIGVTVKARGIIKYCSVFWVINLILGISSAEEGVSKPSIRIFEIALKRGGCHPFDAVMIGDRLDNDIVPAKKIAMLTIWIKQEFGGMGNPTLTEDTPNYIIHRVDDLIQLLRIYRMLVWD